jgi:hypothetical protein
MAHEHEPPPDVEIAASARAKEVRFDAAPVVRVRFPGTGERDSRQVTTRQNVDSPVEPGRTYRRVVAGTHISSRLLDPWAAMDYPTRPRWR